MIWIALLRGINVGGRKIVPMAELRAVLSGLDYNAVQTYIQSGNCVFESADSNAANISDSISAAIDAKFGFVPKVMTLSLEALLSARDNNPFANVETPEKFVHFYFLFEPASAADIEALDALKTPSETYALTDAVFYLHAPDGIGRSKLAARAEQKLGVAATARNFRTVTKLLSMAGLNEA